MVNNMNIKKETNKERNERLRKQSRYNDFLEYKISRMEPSCFSDQIVIDQYEQRNHNVKNCPHKESCLDYALDYLIQDGVPGGGINWDSITHYHDRNGNLQELPEDFDHRELKIFNS